jgi:2,4-dienoyl-CoA reductase [(3E)-enoyl-CoA-producing], peroxisomal
MPLQTHGTAAKAGVDALSHCAAIELGPRGITSNIIAPGAIQGTEGVKRLSRVEGLDDVDSTSRIPAGRMGWVKEIADATIYLFADTGSYVNGATLVGKCIFPQGL